jgi:hypothetical protein
MKTFIFKVRYSDGLVAHQGISAVSRKEAEAKLEEQREVGQIDFFVYLKQYQFIHRIS